MENQHRKIKGYRELTGPEISLMNRIKEKGAELLALQAELQENLAADFGDKEAAVDAARTPEDTAEAVAEYNRFRAAEPMRWAAIGKTDIETGVMALVRAVAQPG